MPTAWRIVKTRYAEDPFSGEGARRYGGRWNSAGGRMVYTSGSVALAVLEVLIHIQHSRLLPAYSLCSARFDEALVSSLARSQLPEGWRAFPPPLRLQELGDRWLQSEVSAVLEVPSAIVDRESNYLINPEHPDFGAIVLDPPVPFEFDLRLLGRRDGPDR